MKIYFVNIVLKNHPLHPPSVTYKKQYNLINYLVRRLHEVFWSWCSVLWLTAAFKAGNEVPKYCTPLNGHLSIRHSRKDPTISGEYATSASSKNWHFNRTVHKSAQCSFVIFDLSSLHVLSCIHNQSYRHVLKSQNLTFLFAMCLLSGFSSACKFNMYCSW